jgi:hypothetical protein
MTRNGRLRMLAASCVLIAVVVAFTGAHAWAKARQTEARCLRPPVAAAHPGMVASGRPVAAASRTAISTGRPAAGRTAVPAGRTAASHAAISTGRPPAPAARPTDSAGRPAIGRYEERGSWRAHTLRAAGCGAWRQVHDRMRHRRN